MKQTESLKKTFEFRRVYTKGTSIANRLLVMYVLKNGQPYNRLGISVSKKVGNSVIRSRVTRLIRESYRLQEEQVEIGYDIVIIARNTAKEATYWEIDSAVKHLFKKHKIKKIL
ncbi:MAG: ribonuclease P protein component [Epulopiscium sp.]|nr:ribonuclease P protein component [Candidatus Epulonipiscium sp.]